MTDEKHASNHEGKIINKVILTVIKGINEEKHVSNREGKIINKGILRVLQRMNEEKKNMLYFRSMQWK